MIANNIIEANVGSDGTINNDKLNQEITDLKYEEEAGHERNINNMTQVDEYESPGKYTVVIGSYARRVILKTVG